MKKCNKCNKEIIRSPRANNVKYCHECRQEAYKYTEYRTQWQREQRDKIATTEKKGKIACVFCGKYYIKPVSHAWQVHGMEEREYKDYAGLDHKKGVIPLHHKELLQDHVKANYAEVVAKNLLKGGRTTRYKKGGEGIGVYKRSKQTMDRLKESHGNFNRRKSN